MPKPVDVRPGVAAGVAVRPAVIGDADAIAMVHRRELPQAFMSKLGEGFLARFYRALIVEPLGLVIVATEMEAVLGFAAATTSMSAFSRRFRWRYAPGAVLRAFPALLRPSTFRGMRETQGYLTGASDLPDAEWISVAVTSDHRERGVGDLLVVRLLADLEAKGVTAIRAMVARDNEACLRLVTLHNFQPVRKISIHDGVYSEVLVRQ
jgi:ribosomal protein S18 acetylase RimI-like enzyme